MREVAVPNSTGTDSPRLAAPAGSCDCHLHVFDPRFSLSPSATQLPSGATVNEYRLLQRRIGTTRAVIVQAKPFGTDNRCVLDAVEQLGLTNARGIAVVSPRITIAELQDMASGGIRGLRFSLWNPRDAVISIDMLEPLAKRIADLGWHIQLHMSGDQIVDNEALLSRLPCPLVVDHMGRIPPQAGTGHLAFKLICRWIEQGNGWVKLSGAYLNTVSGPPGYSDATAVAQAFVAFAPERMVWGSDWPHVTEKEHKPDDALLMDLLSTWIPDKTLRQKVLVDNPAALYGFV